MDFPGRPLWNESLCSANAGMMARTAYEMHRYSDLSLTWSDRCGDFHPRSKRGYHSYLLLGGGVGMASTWFFFSGEECIEVQVCIEDGLFGTLNVAVPLLEDMGGFSLRCEQAEIGAQVFWRGLAEIRAIHHGAPGILPFELESFALSLSPFVVEHVDFDGEQLHLGVGIKFVRVEPFDQPADLCRAPQGVIGVVKVRH